MFQTTERNIIRTRIDENEIDMILETRLIDLDKKRDEILDDKTKMKTVEPRHFKESYIKSLKANKSDVPFTLKSDAVAKVVFKIANTNNPAPRYYITNATYLLGYLKRILSTKMLDKILIKI